MTIARTLATVTFLALTVPLPCLAEQTAHTLRDMPAGLYKSDNQHTHIYFTYDHVGFSRAHGRFDKFDGQLNFDPQKIEHGTASFTIDASSIDMNVPELEQLLKSAKFFDAADMGQITFKSTALKLTSNNKGVLEGALTMHGVTRPVTLGVTLNKFLVDDELKFCRFGFTVTGTLKRSQWGLGAVPLVGDDVVLDIDTEFVKSVN